MLRYNFCKPDGRLVKLFVFPTLLDKSPLTSVYFASQLLKRKEKSGLPSHTTKLFGFWQIYHMHYELQINTKSLRKSNR